MTTQDVSMPRYHYREGDQFMAARTHLNTLAVLMPGFEGPVLPEWVQRKLRAGMAGVCLFRDNVVSREQLVALTADVYAANPNAIIAIDEEGGDVTRLYHHRGSPFPGIAVLGRLADAEVTSSVGEQVGWELRDVGVSLTLAPDVDVNSNPYNPVIGVRSFGDDAAEVADHAAAWVRGVQSTGVAACAKHFPGHGDTEQDSHVQLPVVHITEHVLRDRELLPFRAAIGAGVKTVMTSHIMVPEVDPKYPATLSRIFLQQILREQLRFDGVIVSDALDMAGVSGTRGIPQAAALALAAGCDLLCIGSNNTEQQVDEIADAIAVGAGGPLLTEQRLADARDRVEALGVTLAQERAHRTLPVTFTSGAVPGLTAAQVAASFFVSHHALELLDQHAAGRPVVWLQVQPPVNVAIGPVPWGPFTVEGVVPAVSVGPLDNPAELRDAIPAGAIAILVGRDNHRHAWVREIIDAMRRDGDTIVVDMGWPQPTRTYADVATYGA